MTKKLILIRHAHRDTSKGRYFDNGLSEKGHKQSKKLAKFLLHYCRWTKPIAVISSPKLRCHETLKPLAQKLEIKINTDSLLNEFEGSESVHSVNNFLEEFKTRSELTVFACSHGDWIPHFLGENFQLEIDIKKAGFVVARLKENHLSLDAIVQKIY